MPTRGLTGVIPTDKEQAAGVDALPRQAWNAYREAVGGLAYDGKPLPDWEQLGERQRIGWRVAAEVLRGER